jgi:hypothetical protein
VRLRSRLPVQGGQGRQRCSRCNVGPFRDVAEHVARVRLAVPISRICYEACVTNCFRKPLVNSRQAWLQTGKSLRIRSDFGQATLRPTNENARMVAGTEVAAANDCTNASVREKRVEPALPEQIFRRNGASRCFHLPRCRSSRSWHVAEQVVHALVNDPPLNAEVRAFPRKERVAALTASLESVWP